MHGLWNLDIKEPHTVPAPPTPPSMNSRLCRQQDKTGKSDHTFLGRLWLGAREQLGSRAGSWCTQSTQEGAHHLSSVDLALLSRR